jgi:hypothetical protein
MYLVRRLGPGIPQDSRAAVELLVREADLDKELAVLSAFAQWAVRRYG